MNVQTIQFSQVLRISLANIRKDIRIAGFRLPNTITLDHLDKDRDTAPLWTHLKLRNGSTLQLLIGEQEAP